MKRRTQFFYRGSVTSCNYSCSYCPFCKHKSSSREILQDEKDLSRFADRLLEFLNEEAQQDLYCAVQVVPYGEAVIHAYYWRELARLSRHPRIEYVGAQSNLSFPADQMLAEYEKHDGDRKKLRLWGTFHPQMVTLEEFAGKCDVLWKSGVSLSVGVVGVPEQMEQIRQLRRSLPDQIYVWINRMDGLGRNYTEEERAAFSEIDEYFLLECRHIAADLTHCADSSFVEADGTIRPCNLSRWRKGNFYGKETSFPGLSQTGVKNFQTGDARETITCGRRTCSCYLAYCNRNLPELLFFGPYPAFRIPVYPKAVFFDIDGTLTEENGRIPPERVAQCQALARHCDLYFATSLPLADARRKANGIWEVSSGGVFAGGGMLRIWQEGKDWEQIYDLSAECLSGICQEVEKMGASVHRYRVGSMCYKMTIRAKEGTALREYLEQVVWPEKCHTLWEGECLQITAEGTEKLAGVRKICEKMGYGREEVFVAGNSDNDISMLEFYPFSAKVLSDGWEVTYP